MEISFRVFGRPVQQGSKDIGPQGQLREAAKGLGVWRDLVQLEAMRERRNVGHTTFTGAVEVRMIFFVPVPASPIDPDFPIGPPDLDKYIRAVGDAMTKAGIYTDDSRIVRIVAEKHWARADLSTREGVFVTVDDDPRMDYL